jgi:aryl-alcohol dehydrogenase-like predicted oxidoreductase
LERFVTEQPPYSILVRGIEEDVLPTAQQYGMGTFTSPGVTVNPATTATALPAHHRGTPPLTDRVRCGLQVLVAGAVNS